MNVLVPFDIRPVNERAVRAALDLFAGKTDVHLIAVHVTTSEATPAQIAASEIESMGERRELSVEAELRVVASDSKAEIRATIDEIVEAEAIDLVVIAYEEQSLVEKLFETNTADRMLTRHDTPVLLVP